MIPFHEDDRTGTPVTVGPYDRADQMSTREARCKLRPSGRWAI